MSFSIKPIDTRTFFIAFCYGAGLYALQIFLYKCGILQQFPTAEALINWDAAFYHSIAYQGYSYNNWVSNTAFCPLFPWIWQLAHLGIYGICVLNIVLFASGFTILSKIVKPSVTEQWLWLSIPSIYFTFIPYPEALYFLLLTTTVVGMEYNKRYLIWIALFCAALTRMNIVCLVPAFMLTELITNEPRKWAYALKQGIINYCLPLLAGLAFFVWYQHYVTGVWFAYFIKQSTIWHRVFSIPKLPFQSARGYATFWLNALALFACSIAAWYVLKKIFLWLRSQSNYKDKTFVLACCYMVFSALLIIFFNPKWGDGGTTTVIGAHRYIFAAPFFFIFLNRLQTIPYKWQHYLLAIVLANVCWLSFGSYMHIQELVYFNFNTLLIILYMASGNKKLFTTAIALISINIFMQIIQMQHFLGDLGID